MLNDSRLCEVLSEFLFEQVRFWSPISLRWCSAASRSSFRKWHLASTSEWEEWRWSAKWYPSWKVSDTLPWWSSCSSTSTTRSSSPGLCSTLSLLLPLYPIYRGQAAVLSTFEIFVLKIIRYFNYLGLMWCDWLSFLARVDNTWNTINCFVPTELNMTTGLSNNSVSAVEEFWT